MVECLTWEKVEESEVIGEIFRSLTYNCGDHSVCDKQIPFERFTNIPSTLHARGINIDVIFIVTFKYTCITSKDYYQLQNIIGDRQTRNR